MSSIFDNVRQASDRRKQSVMEQQGHRAVFQGPYASPTPARGRLVQAKDTLPSLALHPTEYAAAQAMQPVPLPPSQYPPPGIAYYGNGAHCAQQPPESGNAVSHAFSVAHMQTAVAYPGKSARNAHAHSMECADTSGLATYMGVADRYSMPQSNTIYLVWMLCVSCTLLPVLVFAVEVMWTPGVTKDMLQIPYKCNIFYFGLFVGLPGITVHLFILSFRFYKACPVAVYSAIAAVGLMVISVEHACSNTPNIGPDQSFFLLAVGILLGLGSQGLLIQHILPKDKETKSRIISVLIGIAMVVVVVDAIFVLISGNIPNFVYSKGNVLLRILPLVYALVMYSATTYFTLSRIHIECKNM